MLAASLVVLAVCGRDQAEPIKVGEEFKIVCNGIQIGTIQLDRYQRLASQEKNQIVIEGGFTQTVAADGLEAGATFKWVQTVKGMPVLYKWQDPAVTYIDRIRKDDDPMTKDDESMIVKDGSPFYPASISFTYTMGYSDFPSRLVNNVPVDLFFETALVCVVDNRIHAIDSFTWGYEVSADNKTFRLKTLDHTGKVSDGLLMAFKNDPDPIFKKWEIERGCCLVPEPGALLLGLAGMGGIIAWRWRRCSTWARTKQPLEAPRTEVGG
jgi:hypothetical protein